MASINSYRKFLISEAAPTPVLSPSTLLRINSAEGPLDAGRGSPAC